MIGKGHHFGQTRRRMRRWPRRILIVTNVLVFVVLASSATVVGYAVYQFDQIGRTKVGDLTPEQKNQQYVNIGGHKVKVTSTKRPPFTVLFVGSDSRAGATGSGLDVGSSATNSENLSDSIILARVAPATHQLALLSIPRDLWVSVPGIGMAKINTAFSGGDANRLVEVIQSDLGIPVNHFAEVSFDSFEQIANAIGGVEQYFPAPAYDYYSDLSVGKAGCVNLKGSQALAFVRSRHYEYELPGEGFQYQVEPESDLGRIQRQQAFIKNAIHKIKKDGDLTNPVTLASLIPSITKNLKVDQTFSNGELLSLAEDFRDINANGIPNTTYPVVNYTVDGQDALTGIPSADQATIDQFESVGTVAPKKKQKTTTTTAPARAGSPTTSTSTTLPHSGISVEVENGSGTADQATEASNDLTGDGYAVSGSTDAADFSYTSNVVEYGPEGEAAAETLQGSLAGGATLTADSSLTGTDLVLITGSAWNGLGSPSSSDTAPPSSTTTLTVPPATGTIYGSTETVQADSSSYYHGIYIPPGREPGQSVETCGN